MAVLRRNWFHKLEENPIGTQAETALEDECKSDDHIFSSSYTPENERLDTQKKGLEKVSPFKHGNSWYLCIMYVRFPECRLMFGRRSFPPLINSSWQMLAHRCLSFRDDVCWSKLRRLVGKPANANCLSEGKNIYRHR